MKDIVTNGLQQTTYSKDDMEKKIVIKTQPVLVASRARRKLWIVEYYLASNGRDVVTGLGK